MKTGRDVVVAALLGAEEYGFATAPLVVEGCVMMRVCHMDTCPVGIATQNPELRKRFTGDPEMVVKFFEFIAEEVREHLAALGLRSLREAVGRVDLLDTVGAVEHWKASGLDLSPILAVPEEGPPTGRSCRRAQDHGLDKALDAQFIESCRPAIEHGEPVSLEMPIRNVDRTVGTLLGYEISSERGGEGLRDGLIDLTFRGSAGQSFGAFVPRGVTLRLVGDANDYLAKGLSGGRVVVRPPEEAPFAEVRGVPESIGAVACSGVGLAAEDQIVAGNVILYGATAGEAFIRGQVGERFCVRNSGATAVVEGVGDHGCEYMTGGRVVVLGPTGRNFGAGMSGGIAYVWDPARRFEDRVNLDMVDLEPLDEEDRRWLAEIVGRHGEETGSAVAARLLASWGTAVGDFVKVMPRDYRRVLEATRRAVEGGTSIDDAVMASSRG
jgi:glutamate synthase (NADPH/NADH) large chain